MLLNSRRILQHWMKVTEPGTDFTKIHSIWFKGRWPSTNASKNSFIFLHVCSSERCRFPLGTSKVPGLFFLNYRKKSPGTKCIKWNQMIRNPFNTVLLELIYCCNDLFELHVLTTPICMPNDAENNPALFSFRGGGGWGSVFLRVSFICRFLFKISKDGLFSF